MTKQEVFVALGSNLGDSAALLCSGLEQIRLIPTTEDLKVSSFYKTPPVSDIPQPDYINAVCRFITSLSPPALHQDLVRIEQLHGKRDRSVKNGPRFLDLDILFYGTKIDLYASQTPYIDATLVIPHPRWQERLFVLLPLSDLIEVPQEIIDRFSQEQQQALSKYFKEDYAHDFA